MSFVNLMSNEIWTDYALSNRVAGIIRSTVSQDDELKAARLSRKAAMSDKEAAFVDRVDADIAAAIEQGRLARADAQLLAAVIEYEAAFDRLDESLVLEPTSIDATDTDGNVTQIVNPAMLTDIAERNDAQLVIDSANADVIVLFTQRNPPVVEPEVIVEAPIIDAVSEAAI
jgi:hypothetical protein